MSPPPREWVTWADVWRETRGWIHHRLSDAADALRTWTEERIAKRSGLSGGTDRG